MQPSELSFAELEQWLVRTPVLAKVHPLVPLCFSAETQIVTNATGLLRQLDERQTHLEGSLLVLDHHPILCERFPSFQSLAHPPIDAINRNMPNHLEYARTHLLTTHKVAEYIVDNVVDKQPEAVVLFLVDGLGYGDIQSWPYSTLQPCFVDGPSVTYRFREGEAKSLVGEVGFTSIINRPSIYDRLYSLGYQYARGYTYWSPGGNEIADYMFLGIPYQRVANFEGILRSLESESVRPGMYVQIVRQGARWTSTWQT